MRFRKGRWWNTSDPNSKVSCQVPELRCFAVNINGLNRSGKRSQLSSIRRLQDWSVLMLSDTRIHDEREFPNIERSLRCNSSAWSLGTPHVGGCSIMFFVPVTLTKKYSDPSGHFCRADVIWEGETFSFLCIYAPADVSQRKSFFSVTLRDHLGKHPLKSKAFIAGDFNFVENPLLDRASKVSGGVGGHEQWQELFTDQQIILHDLFRNFQPDTKSFTFRSAAHGMHTRIDRCYASDSSLSYAGNCRHVPVPSIISDHLAGVEFSVRGINCSSRGPSFWKLNVSLLKKPGFAKIVKQTLNDFQCSKDRFSNPAVWWDMLKLALSIEIKNYSKQQAIHKKRTILTMESQILQVHQQLASNPTDASLIDRKVRLDLILADYYDDICEAARLKAGLKYHCQGEKPSRYFSALVKQRSEKSGVTCLKYSKDGIETTLTDIEDILEYASSFYASLYADKLSQDQKVKGVSYLDNNVSSFLSKAEKDFCDRPISIEEMGRALKSLPAGKAPGIDGLPAEFLKLFWHELKDDLLQVLRSCFDNGCLSESMRMSIITLIYKKDSRENIKNYRPISLLCTDYKIIAKCLAERMKHILPRIIAPDQTGFMKNRYIGENITIFLDVQEYSAKEMKPGLSFLADWEKAYDLIDRSFLKNCLTRFGFGFHFIHWFEVLHCNNISKLIVNSFLSSPFSVKSGVRQGCPWAPFLFLAAVEPLATALRQSDLQGFDLPDGRRLIYSGYADDTTLYLSGLSDLDSALKIFAEYSEVSGMRLNMGKSSIVPLGSLIDQPKPPDCPFRWLTVESDAERLLGVPVGVNFLNDLIWKDLLMKLSSSLKHWSAQKLSIFGRIHAARSYIGGQSWFLATMVPPSAKGLKRLTAMLWAYVQNNNLLDASGSSNVHYSAWPRRTLLQKFADGGLNAQDYEIQLQATHAKWIFNLLDPRHVSSWKSLPFYFLHNMIPGLGDSIFTVDSCVVSIVDTLPPRWAAYFASWLSSGLLVSPPPLDYECILNEPIWFNRFLYLNHNDSKRGRLLKKDVEISLIRRGFLHLSDLLSTSFSAGNSSPWLTKEEAIFKAGSTRLGNHIYSLIGLIPSAWSTIVKRKSREPFKHDEWVIRANECNIQPYNIYRILQVDSKKLLCASFQCIRPCSYYAPILIDMKTTITLGKAHAIKACILKDKSDHNHSFLLYCGNYRTSKLLLSRFSWKFNEMDVGFLSYTVKNGYRAILDAQSSEISAIAKWETKLNFPISLHWKSIIKYLHDPCLSNKSREKLYKIYTRALPVARKFASSSSNPMCCFCNIDEDEMHCIVSCNHASNLWTWIRGTLSPHISWVSSLSDMELLFGFPLEHNIRDTDELHIWKIFHAETVRVIWFSRCRKLFDDEDIQLTALKSIISHRIQMTYTLIEGSASSNSSLISQNWKRHFPLSTVKNGRLRLQIPQ